MNIDNDFPKVNDIEVTVKESGKGVTVGFDDTKLYTKNSLPDSVYCSNEACNGKINIFMLIHQMVINNITDEVFKQRCEGFIGSPKGRVKYADCWNYFEINIKLKYKEIANKVASPDPEPQDGAVR